MSNLNTLLTLEEFREHPAAHERNELVHGVLCGMTPAGGPHGRVSGTVFRLISNYVEEHGLGVCFPDGTGFALPGVPDTVRSPDAAFVRADRLAPTGIAPGWIPAAPDLVVEVLSPSDTAPAVEQKITDYLAAGTRLIWVIDPEQRMVTEISADAPRRLLREGDTLRGGAVLRGFECAVERLFVGLAR